MTGRLDATGIWCDQGVHYEKKQSSKEHPAPSKILLWIVAMLSHVATLKHNILSTDIAQEWRVKCSKAVTQRPSLNAEEECKIVIEWNGITQNFGGQVCVNLAPQLTKDISARKLGVDENEVTAWNMFVIRDLSRPLSHLKVTKVPLNKHNFFRTSIENLSLQCHYIEFNQNLTRKGNWCAPLLLRYDENRWSDMSSAESSDRRGIL